MKISVLIPALNEASNIADCISSVAWCDDIVVVDSHSTDATAEIASALGARVVQFNWNGRYPKKKNWSIQHIDWKHPWILILDADERITPELRDEIIKLESEQASGWFINRRFMFLGRWIGHCGYYPSWNLRLFRHELGLYEQLLDGDTDSGDNEVHEHVVVRGTTGKLANDMLHFAYPSIKVWMEKHNRYSSWEAFVENEPAASVAEIGQDLSFRRKIRMLSRRLPFRPALRFVYSYIFMRGFLDGYPGFALCYLMAIYESLIVMKSEELRRSRVT